jgi:hypothetical protein
MGVSFRGLRISVTYFVGDMSNSNSNAGGALRRLLSSSPGQTVIQYNGDGSVSSSWNIFVDATTMPGFNPILTYWNATSNSSVSVGLNPKPVVYVPVAPDMLPADSEVSLIVVVLTVFLVDVALTMLSFLAVK